ncbi:DUF5763 domain-containing protein [Chitinophaga rhizophila]|uniref:Uncharacterized protein n=1 Tax=Chitinophaga rhizophila TaxID=2866212 RepID=A0ABS7G897_9BACT|nr:DUF5763 domain-containing protein [Chitinophaga rhizophila]MBW8683860.1 hypothetical protein [Chitinophaga rhizophila]
MDVTPYRKDKQTRWIKAGILIVLVQLLVIFKPGLHSQSVYKTPYGKKYHTADCRMVKNVSQQLSLSEARRLHLEPCLICHPETEKAAVLPRKKPAGTGATVRCNGITKKGTRCKHMTSIANGYCFQHQPD